jgi:hypothetical protein
MESSEYPLPSSPAEAATPDNDLTFPRICAIAMAICDRYGIQEPDHGSQAAVFHFWADAGEHTFSLKKTEIPPGQVFDSKAQTLRAEAGQ